MAICPWGALGGGKFKTQAQIDKNDGRKMGGPPSEKHMKVAGVLDKIAKAKGTIMTSVALAYVMHQSPDVYPIGMFLKFRGFLRERERARERGDMLDGDGSK